MSAEQRIAPRKKLQQFLLVHEAGTGRLLGRMVDISMTGMMLIGSDILPLHHVFKISIQPPDQSGLPPLLVQAETVWVRSSEQNRQHHGCGMQFRELTPESLHSLEQLVNHAEL